MSVWLDIIGSVFLAGFVLLSGITLNQTVSDHAFAATNTLSVQEGLVGFMNVMESDFRKIGYGVTDPSQAILISDPDRLTYQADIDRDGSIEVVEWRFVPMVNGNGDRAGRITRSVNGGEPALVATQVEAFSIRYLKEDGTLADTTSKGQIWLLETSLGVKSPYKVADQVMQGDRRDEVHGFWRQTRLASRNIKRHG